MIEKLDTELLESNRRYYERELARPKYKVRNIDGRASSVEAATFCNSLETFLTTYKTVSETLEAGKYLDGSSSQKRAFINIFSLYAAAAEAAGKITKVRARSNQNKNGQIEIKVDFSQGTYSLADQVVTPLSNSLGRIKDSGEMLDFAAAYFSSVIQKTKEISKIEDYNGFNEALTELHLQVGEITVNGFNYSTFSPKKYSFLTTLDDIVGNEEMITTLKRAMRNVLKYDPESKQNVMQTHFDGFQRTFTFYGEPGCGKTATIEATLNYATELARKVCKPLIIENVTNAFKSEYYSKSTQNLKEIFDRVKEGRESYILIFEDIDTILFSRDELKNRPEDKVILGEMMNYLEGIEAPKQGNDLIIVTTNNPLSIDNALFSRLGESQIYVPGPKTAEDFTKLFQIKLKKSIEAGLVKASEKEWEEMGEKCVEARISGRDIKNISKLVLAQLYSREEPDEILSLNQEKQLERLLQIYSPIGHNTLKAQLDLYLMSRNQIEGFENGRVH